MIPTIQKLFNMHIFPTESKEIAQTKESLAKDIKYF